MVSSINYCTCYFESNYAFLVENLNDEPINRIEIKDYLKNENLQKDILNKNKFLICKNKNELIIFESILKKQFVFNHKTAKYMTKWHEEWQNKFKPDNEIKIGDRYADAIVNDIVLEFQHSQIETDLVIARLNNYTNHNKLLYWIIDCTNDCLKVKQLGDIFQIKFKKDYWKYESFLSHDFIFLDYYDSNEKINKMFKINPNKVKSKMTDVIDYHTKKHFIKCLKDNTFSSLYINDELPQCTLYHNQRGAGCGKTYESIQILQDKDKFINKKLFIYLTKMHTAREVIFNESNKLQDITIIKTKDGKIAREQGKQYIIEFKTNDKEKCEIIIGTIDSFVFALGKNHVDNNSNDYFGSMAKKIRDGSVDFNYGCKRYGGINMDLSKECLIIIDEAQDLEPHYVEAVCTLMRSTYIDAYLIGDKLQSLSYKINTHTFLETEDLPNINIIRNTGDNIVRRFHNSQFIDFVNSVIKFEQFGLPPIIGICDGNCKYKHENEKKPYKLFEIEPVYSNDYTVEKVNKSINYIIESIDREVNENNYLPNNFMFIFPILKNNYLANRLESEIQNYWINKFDDDNYKNNVLLKDDYWKQYVNNNKYNRYVYLHRSEEGKPINLKESENATRIMSIHASKGNGCEVVFLLGLCEKSLRTFSIHNNSNNDDNDIIYESLLHVALTRQKEKLYVGITNYNDDITNRLSRYLTNNTSNITPKIENIKNSIRFSELIKQFYNDNCDCELLRHCNGLNNIRKLIEYDTETTKEREQNIIDWGHHVIRRYVFKYYMLYNIYNNNCNATNDCGKNSQLMAKISGIATLKIIPCKNIAYFKELNNIYKNNSNKSFNKNNKLPILVFENSNSKYKKYEQIIIKFIENIQNKIKFSCNKNKIPLLCPLEIIILYYCIETTDRGPFAEITIMDIYNIIYCYDECSNEIDEEHNKYECNCSEYFNEANNNEACKYKEIRNSIVKHYNKTIQIANTFNNFKTRLEEKYDKLTKFHFNIEYPISFGGCSNNFKLWKLYDIIASSNEYVLYFNIKPQLNKLNFNETIFEIIYNIYFLSNIKESNAKIKFADKQIIVCLFSLDSEDPILLTFDININFMTEFQNNLKKYLINDYTKKHNIVIAFNEYCRINNLIPIDIIDNDSMKYKTVPEYIKRTLESLKDGDIDDNNLENRLNKKCIDSFNTYFNGNINCSKIITNNENMICLDKEFNDNIIQVDKYDYDEFIDDEFINDNINEFIDDENN